MSEVRGSLLLVWAWQVTAFAQLYLQYVVLLCPGGLRLQMARKEEGLRSQMERKEEVQQETCQGWEG